MTSSPDPLGSDEYVAAKRHSPVIAPPLEYTGTERVVCSRCGTVEHPGWPDEICLLPLGLAAQRGACRDCPHSDYCASMGKCVWADPGNPAGRLRAQAAMDDLRRKEATHEK